MTFNKKLSLSLLSALLVLAGCSGSTSSNNNTTSQNLQPLAFSTPYNKPRVMSNFNDYVLFLKDKALAEGVSKSVLAAQNNIQYMPKAVALDQAQAGRSKRDPSQPPIINPNATTNYLNKVLTSAKVDTAVERYDEVRVPLQQASRKYGVQQEYLLALWGMESSFGYYQGSYDVLSALATLAFDGRREDLFAREFINAMKMLQQDHIQRHKMLGSRAGAMGQTQFMPSSFLSYAADGNGDGLKDIWSNQFDVFASIANYLHSVGWDDKLPWGVEVTLSEPISYSLSGIEKAKSRSLSQWQSMGVGLKSFTAENQEKLTALANAELWLVMPDREAGRIFLVSNNFRTILDWNKSNYFAISIGMFADRIKEETGL